MPQPNLINSTHKEGQLVLAKLAFEGGQFKSIRAAAAAFGVPNATLSRRINGTTSRRDWRPKSTKLTKLEEETIVKYVLELDSRGFAPRLSYVRDMADDLLSKSGGKPVGVKWPNNFVKRTPELKVRYKRRYDYQRAKCEDPSVIIPWFDLVRDTIVQKGVDPHDIYNFDETGFAIGVISGGMVVTGAERRNRPKAIQPGNRLWVTAIQCICAEGWAIPPFIIFPGKTHSSAWYEENIPNDWVFGVSDKGWTNNELGLAWIKHFDKSTRGRRVGTYRLLLLDGHESHESIEFRDYCEANQIIPLCMPAHASHLLQPLDVGCFGPLKKAYGNQIEDLMRNYIQHISPSDFIPAFKAAHQMAMTKSNILGSFRGSGLVPYEPDAVLSRLEVRLRTPTPPIIDLETWEGQTPSNLPEMVSQTCFIKSRISHHQDSSPTPINTAVDRFLKGAQVVAHRLTLLEMENSKLRKANEALSQRKARKRRRIQTGGTLSRGDGLELMTQHEVEHQIFEESRVIVTRDDGSVVSQRRCGLCRQPGHRRETCQMRLSEPSN
jgi:hypothetical protein